MAKTKVSVTIEQSVLERVDRVSKGKSRSEIVESALKRWLIERRRRADRCLLPGSKGGRVGRGSRVVRAQREADRKDLELNPRRFAPACILVSMPATYSGAIERAGLLKKPSLLERTSTEAELNHPFEPV